MTRIAIIGSGEHAKKIAFEIEKIKNLSLAGFIDEKLKIGQSIQKINNKRYKVISNIKGLKNKKFKNIRFVIGIGSNYTRFKVVEDLKKKKIQIVKISEKL